MKLPMERNEECLHCGRKYFKEYARKMNIELTEEEIKKYINMKFDNLRHSGDILFPLIWYKKGIISKDSYKTILKEGDTKCLKEHELKDILEADPEKKRKRKTK